MTADSPIPVVSAKDTAAVLDAVDRTGVVVLDGLFDLDFVRAVKAECEPAPPLRPPGR